MGKQKRKMANFRSFSLPLALIVASCIAASAQGGADGPCAASHTQAAPASRLSADWDSSALATVPGSRPAAPQNAIDIGLAPAGQRLNRMLLLLAPTDAQRQALDTELTNQQTPGSCEYHHWLTAQQFADAYSNSAADVNAIAAWLSGQGFAVAPLPAGRGWIEFSGTVGQVEQTFNTSVHSFAEAGAARYALSDAISVPAPLVPVIRGLVSLDGAISSPALTSPRAVQASPAALAAQTSISQAEALTPQLVSQLLHLDALHAAGATGTGQSIAIAARSNIQGADIDSFRSSFGLPANPVKIVPGGADPGLTGDQAEAELAASWAGVAAPGAHIIVVPAASTAATDGVDLSLAAMVDQQLANTVVVDFSACEPALSGAHQAFYAAIYRQAAAEGISAIAASGDSGAAACFAAGGTSSVSTGYAVNALASTPWNTAVGAAAFASAQGDLSAWSPVNIGDPAYAGGGGASATYSAPAWQTGLPAAQTQRALPDLVLPAGVDAAFSRGLAFCFSGSSRTSGCNHARSGGTSAAAAIFGGISALIAQKYEPQGNLAPNLYALSSHSGIFSDIQQGNTRLPCAAGTPDCNTTGHIGYEANAGFDLATGLGSPDAQKLVNSWASLQPAGLGANTVTLTVSPNQSSYNPSASITFTATVTSGTGGATPTGSINFNNQTTGNNLNGAPYALDGSGTASITVVGALPKNGNNIVAQYSGDGTYAAQNSQVLPVNIQPSSTSLTVTPATTTPTPGTAFNVTVTLAAGTPPAGTASATGNVQLTLDGANYQTQPLSTTGSTTSATFSVTVASGSHNLQAIYAGDTNYATSTSTSVPVNAQAGTATVTLAVAPTQANATYNPSASVTFTATVASTSGGATPTGTVNFFDQATGANLPNGTSVTLDSSGHASVTVAGGLPKNGNSIIAQYGGDKTYAAQNSQALTVNIQPSSTTVTVTPSTTTPTPGTAFNVTVALTVGSPPAGAAAPTGSVQLTLDGANYQSQPLATSGPTYSATFSVTVQSGQHNLQAIYAGDANYSTSTSQSVSVGGQTGNASVALAVSPIAANATYNPSATITFTATVASTTGGATPTGTVNFFDQATGSNINPAPVALVSGTASVTETGQLPVNGNSVQAKYSGDSTYGTANSQALTVNIQPSSTTTTVAPSTTTPAVGVAFPVTVAVTVGTPPAGTAVPTGKVTLTLDGTPYANSTLATTGGNASASFNVTVNSTGPHNLQAIYAGDANYATSTSAAVSVNSAMGATVTTLTATPPTLTPGTPESFTATIAAASPVAGATNTFTGTVTFFDGTAQLGTVTVAANAATLPNVNLSNTVTHVITAMYSGDGNWSTSTSNAITLKPVLFPVTVALTATPTTAGPGQVITFTATVTPQVAPASAAEQNPTGNIVFYNGTTIMGTVALSAGPNNTSMAQLLFATLPAGQDTITAAYVGDLFYAAATSNAVTVTIQDFSLAPGLNNPPADLDINKGQSGTFSYVVTGLGGYNNIISVVCNTPPQDDMTCTASPQQVTPTGTATFTITTYLTGGPATTARNRAPLWPGAAGGTAFAALLFLLLPWGKRVRVFTERGRKLLILVLLLAGLSAAGIGCTSVSGAAANNATGTPLGETTVTITAAAYIDNTVVSHSAYLLVNVLAPGATGTSVPAGPAR